MSTAISASPGASAPAENLNPDQDGVRAPEFVARYARLVSKPKRPQLRSSIILALATGGMRGVAMLVLLPASVALATDTTSWGLCLPGWLWILVGLAIASGVLEYILAVISYQVALDLLRNTQTRIGDKLTRLPLGWFRDSAAGRLSRLVSSELLMLGEYLAHILFSAAAGASTAIVILAGSWVWDWRLGLVLTIAAPIFVLALWLGSKALTHGTRLSDSAEAELSDRIVEFAKAQGALRSAGRATDFDPLTDANRKAVRAGRADLWWAILANLLHGLVGQLIVVTLILVAAELTTGGALGPIPAIAFIGLSLRFVQTLEDLGRNIISMEERHAMIDNVNDILTARPLPEPIEPATLTEPGSVRLTHVHFSYDPDAPVLNDVTLDLPTGNMVALVGPSGSGKTTIAKLIARFYDVDTGTVQVGGVDVREQTTEQLMQQLSMVFQDVYLFDDTLDANIRVGNPNASIEAVREAADLAGVTEIINRLPRGLATPVGEGGHALSGGERQRVSIARALLKHAPIVLFDEATSALDPENETHVVASLNRLRTEATLLVIAHKLDTIRTANQIVVLGTDGTVVQRGTHQQLLAEHGQYQDFWHARERAEHWALGQES